MAWHHHTEQGPSGIHVWPGEDLIEHELDNHECVCGPLVEYVDENGETYRRGPVVTHHSLDNREKYEREGSDDPIGDALRAIGLRPKRPSLWNQLKAILSA